MIINKTVEISNKLYAQSNSSGFDFLLQAANKVVDTAANFLLVTKLIYQTDLSYSIIYHYLRASTI